MPKNSFTVIRDTREQTGHFFEECLYGDVKCAGQIITKLDTGDYTLLGMEDKLCIERKASVAELATNLGTDSKRFHAEIARMSPFPHKFLLLEFSLGDLLVFPYGSSIPKSKLKYIKMTGSYMLKMLTQFQVNNGIQVMFCDSPENAKHVLISLFKRINELYS